MKHIALFSLLLSLLLITACIKDDPGLQYDVPDTYAFANVDYSGQTDRLNMLSEIKSYLSSANTPGVVLDTDRLLAMYENDAAEADWTGAYEASKQLRNKTFESEVPVFLELLAAIAEASAATVPAQQGQAGVIESLDGTKQYLLNANGVELTQLIEKGLMGAVFYYQATQVYLGDSRMNVDNGAAIPGKGTEMEHHWDEAFGYWGVPLDFPSNTANLPFWAHYTHSRNPLLELNIPFMEAFIRGRAAISNDDLETRDQAIGEIRDYWEQVVAGTALHYINAGVEKFDDMALRAHNLSEAVAFIYSLQFNPEARVSLSQIYALLERVGGSEELTSMNLYQVTKADLQAAADELAAYYGWENIKGLF